MTTRDELNALVEAELLAEARARYPYWDGIEPIVQGVILARLRVLLEARASYDGKAQRPEGSAEAQSAVAHTPPPKASELP